MGGAMMAERDYDFDLSELTTIGRLKSRDWRPNTLIVCSESSRESLTRQVALSCLQPVHICELPGPLNLPAACGTLLLSDMAAMEVRQQLALYDWLSQHGHTRVVSITSADLPSLIKGAVFLEGLYYRLNTVRVEARTPYPLSRPVVRDRSLWL